MPRARSRLAPLLTAVATLSTAGTSGGAAQLRDQTRIAPVNDLPNPYRRVEPWAEALTGAYDERTAIIGVEQGPDGNLYVLGRCRANSCRGRSEPPVLVLDPEGRLLRSWGTGMFVFPHGFALDREGNVWATDQQGHQVFAWTSEGELLLTLGRAGEEGDPPERLSEPTDVAIAEDGTIFVSEGHSFAAGANRVSKFAPDGTFLESWGSTGSGIGELNVPHTLAIDARGRVLVGDRGNNRIQIFDRDGRFLDVWYEFGRPSGIAIGPGDRLYVADSESWGTDNPGWKKGIRVGSALDGSVDYLIEDLEATSIEHSGAEGVGVDREGNVYGGVVRRRMLERHEPVRGGAEESAPRAAPAGMPPHVAHLAATFPGAPGERGLVAAATTEAGIATLHANLAAGNLSDLGAMRLHARHVLHALAPDGSAERPGTGLGLVRASEAVAAHAEMAAAQPGAREATRTHAGHLMMLARSLAARASEAATVARELASASSIRDAAPLVAELRLLVYRIAEGGDADRDGELALDGEAGLQQLEAHLYLLLEGEGLPRVIR